MRSWLKYSLTTLGAAVAGCTVGPNYQTPKVNLPEHYGSNPSTTLPTTQAASQLGTTTAPAMSTRPASEKIADLALWWKGFEDPILDSLIERATKGNLSVRQYEARLREARATLGIDAAPLYPSLSANGGLTRQRGGGAPVSNTWTAGLDASWEIDVFGGTRRQVENGRALVEAAELDRRSTVVSTLAEVAMNYVTLRGAQQRIRIAMDNIESERETLKLNESRFQAGIDSEAEVAQARAQVAIFEATIPPLRIQESVAIHALSVLLGEAPESLKAELSAPKEIPMALPTIPVGLPSELLRRRPDVAAAERRLAAQTALNGVATSDLFPKFSLTGSFGSSAGQIKSIGSQRSLFWSVGPAVSWNVFDAGQIRSNIKLQSALQQEDFAIYESTILTSLQDVEDAIVQYKYTVEQREALRRAVIANQRSVELVSGRFYGGQGVATLLDVLVAQQNLFSAEDSLVTSESQLSQYLVSVYKALGGGWETIPENPPTTRGTESVK
jgi:NodT family efflux transporter outer membrane factor (OMF) lipoprotein